MSSLTGLGRVVRLVLRHDRVRLPLWALALVGFIVSSAASLPPLYPDQESVDDYARLFGDNPALVAFAGPGYGFDDPNLGVVLVNETQLWACVGMALMSIFLVNRHTRQEEDAERTDLLRSSVVGRHVPVTAAVLVVCGAQLAIAATCAAGFVALGYDVSGSLALAGSFAACGLAFAGIAAVTAQVAGGSRASLGLAAGALGTAFAIRAVGDIGENALRWFSPIGWAQGVRAFAGERWWMLGLDLGFAVAMVVLALWFSTVRDVGSGLLSQRPGPARATRWMTRPVGLAFRLQRGSLGGWCVGLLLTGLVYGSIGDDIEEMIEENPAYADFLTQAGGVDITDAYFATAMAMLALLTTGFAVSSALRARSEEVSGRAESFLASPVPRSRWIGGHLVVTVGGTCLVMAAGGAGIGAAYAVVTGDAGQVVRMIGAALVTVPAILVLVGVAVAFFGVVPRWSLAVWGVLAASILVELFGELLRLPAWSRMVSPFHHLPDVPAEDIRVLPLVVLLVLAAVLAGIGVSGLRTRDIRS